MRNVLMIGLVAVLMLSAGSLLATPNEAFEIFEMRAFVASLWDSVVDLVFGSEGLPIPDPVGSEEGVVPIPDPIGVEELFPSSDPIG